MDKQRTFITGGAGFIGANLIKYLLDKSGCDITVYDNLSTGSEANLNSVIADSKQNGNVEFIKADILDFEKLDEAIAGHNAVVHLAAHTQVRQSIENPRESLSVNSTGTFNVLEASRRHNVDRFVFASSNAVVGEQTPPINESMIPRPVSPYGAVKLYGEALCTAYYFSYGLKTVALRFANAYGPYSDHKKSVVAKFVKRVEQDKPLEIYGDGNQTRDFIHAQDIAQAIHLVITHNASTNNLWGEVFQVATGQETKIIDLAKMITNFADATKHPITFAPQIRGEVRKNFSDISKARKILGFSPRMKLDAQLRTMWIEAQGKHRI